MARTSRFLILFALVASSVLFASSSLPAEVLAQRGDDTLNSCPVMVSDALQLLGDNCDGVERNGACYGYYDVNATFSGEVDPDIFSEPSDLAALSQITALRTAPVDLEENRWGIAVMEVQANVPNTLPGQSVIFLLMGDAEVQNAVEPASAFIPADPVSITLDRDVTARSQPTIDANEVGEIEAGATLAADALSEDGAWLRVVVNEQVAWVPMEVVAANRGLERLPTLTPASRTPMQSFYFTTGISNPQCNEAPNAVTVRSRRDMQIALTVNGVDVTIGSTITFRSIAEDEILITVQEGHLETNDGRRVQRNETINAITSPEGEVAVWGEIRPASSLERQIGAISFLGLSEVTPEAERTGHLLDYLGVASLPAFGGDSDLPEDAIMHEVQEGETLFSIASLYDTSLAEIIADNGLTGTDVSPGQQLLIAHPGSGYINYDNNTQVDSANAAPTNIAPDCSAFAARSPLNGLNRGVNAFYWTPLQNATSYQVRVRNLDEGTVVRFDTSGPQTALAGDVGETNTGDGTNFAWEVLALVDGEVACTSPRVTLPRSFEARDIDTGLALVPPQIISLPEPGAIAPVANCVIDHFDGTYTARFGYVSDNVTDYTIDIGTNNNFNGTANRGQPTVFGPGTHADVVRVRFNDGESVSWTLRSIDGSQSTATATADSAPCLDQPAPLAVTPIAECVIDHFDGTYTARFDSNNSNPGTVRVLSGADNRVSVRGVSVPVMIGAGINDAFEVKFNSSVTWTLRGPDGITRTATASPDTRRCADQPAPLPVNPVAECIIDHFDGTYTARFGYNNSNPGNVLILTGSGNIAGPEPQGTPPTMLSPGRVNAAVTVSFSASSLEATWTLRGPDGVSRTASVTTDAPRCADQPPPRPVTPATDCVIDHYDGTYTARFNVDNQNLGRVLVEGGNNTVAPNTTTPPTMLRRGRTNNAVNITFSDTATWTLRGPDGVSRSATASGDTPRCADQPPPDRPVIPQVECVIANYDLAGNITNYTARFGYFNDHTIPVSIGIGANNSLSNGSGGQPATFAPRRQNNVFSVDFTENVTWTLRGLDGVVRNATASPDTSRCADQPPRPLPGNLSPVLECVVENFDPLTGLTTGYTARFGYARGPATGILIAAGQRQPYSNFFAPGGNLGQPSTFGQGRAVDVFSVDFTQGNLVWHLNGRTATASTNSQRCADQPARPTPGSLAPVAECVIENYNEAGDITGYTARFGYTGAPEGGFSIAAGQVQPYNNQVIPGSNMGQPGFFNPGPVSNALSLNFTGGSVTWNLNGRSATLSADSPRCDDQPARPLPPLTPVAGTVTDLCDGTFVATFGYVNGSTGNPANVPVGAANSVTGGSGSPPTQFAPGTHNDVFRVRFSAGSTVTWTLRGGTASLNASQAANTCPTPTPEPTFTPEPTATPLPPQGDDPANIDVTEEPASPASDPNMTGSEETPEVEG